MKRHCVNYGLWTSNTADPHPQKSVLQCGQKKKCKRSVTAMAKSTITYCGWCDGRLIENEQISVNRFYSCNFFTSSFFLAAHRSIVKSSTRCIAYERILKVHSWLHKTHSKVTVKQQPHTLPCNYMTSSSAVSLCQSICSACWHPW